jgi:hypothetical protein
MDHSWSPWGGLVAVLWLLSLLLLLPLLLLLLLPLLLLLLLPLLFLLLFLLVVVGMIKLDEGRGRERVQRSLIHEARETKPNPTASTTGERPAVGGRPPVPAFVYLSNSAKLGPRSSPPTA